MPAERLITFLDSQEIKYVVISHSMAFTALEIAKAAHIPSKEMAKTIVVTIRDCPTMTIVPAAYKFNLNLLREAFGTDQVELTGEDQFSKLFPDCEVGAMPPFGNLYEMDTYVAESVSDREYIAFNAGSHSEIIKMHYRDYEKLASPKFIILAA